MAADYWQALASSTRVDLEPEPRQEGDSLGPHTQSLPSVDRGFLLMSYVQGIPLDEVPASLTIGKAAVKSRIIQVQGIVALC
jgi:hypothetical protein